MRGRFSFVLTASTMLFLLEGLNVMLATLFAAASEALYPRFQPHALLPALIPVGALFMPMLPVARLVERRGAIAATAIVAAAARVLMCLPLHSVRLVTAALVVGAAGVFLGAAVGFLERRSLAGGFGAAVVLDQLARLGGWSWDITLRTTWLAPQLVISIAIAAVAAAWLRMPAPDADESSMERRSGGLRLRGALALGLLLFLDLNVVGRAEVAARWLDVRYELVAVLLIGAGTAATLLLLAGQGPIGRGRRAASALAVIVTLTCLGARGVGGWPGVLAFLAGHGAVLLLLGRALVPAGGRRRGVTVTAGLLLWLVANALYTTTFFPSFSLPFMRDAAPAIFAGAGVLLLCLIVLLPRAIETRPPLHGRVWVGLAMVAALTPAALLAMRTPPARPEAPTGSTLRVATLNAHHGFDDRWRYDPARIMRSIRDLDPDVIALQEAGAGVPVAYGTDLPLYISRRTGLRALLATTHNQLMGDALLVRVPGLPRANVALPPHDAEPKVGIVFDVTTARDTVRILATRLGLAPAEQAAQLGALLRHAHTGPAVLLGDLNADQGSATLALAHAAGFADAFHRAGAAPTPTYPARMPDARIDWILVRDLAVDSAAVRQPVGSDHRMVTATVRIPARQAESMFYRELREGGRKP